MLFQLSASVLGAIWVTSRFSYAWGYYTGGEADISILIHRSGLHAKIVYQFKLHSSLQLESTRLQKNVRLALIFLDLWHLERINESCNHRNLSPTHSFLYENFETFIRAKLTFQKYHHAPLAIKFCRIFCVTVTLLLMETFINNESTFLYPSALMR